MNIRLYFNYRIYYLYLSFFHDVYINGIELDCQHFIIFIIVLCVLFYKLQPYCYCYLELEDHRTTVILLKINEIVESYRYD